MVINNVPIITESDRYHISEIISSQFNEIEARTNPMLTYPPGKFAAEFEYHNTFKVDYNNVVYTSDKRPMMSVFNFNKKNTIKIWKILNLLDKRPILNCIRVFENTTVPMHVDMNKGDIGREKPIYSIVVKGKDGVIYMSNKLDGSKLVAIPGLSQFVMFPTMVQHGAQTKDELMDVLQIQLECI